MATKAASDIADSIRRFARQFQDFQDAAAILDQYGSLDNAVKEAQAAGVAVKAEKAAAEKALAELTAQIATASKRHLQIIAETNQQAGVIIETANTAAFDCGIKAKEEAAGIVAAAKAAAIVEKNALADEILALTASKLRINEGIAVLQANVDGINAEAKKAEDRLAKVKAAISSLATA